MTAGFLNIWHLVSPGARVAPRVPGWSRLSGRAGRVFPLGARGQDHHLCDLLGRDPLARRDPVQDGHLDVKDHQIRLQRRGGRAKQPGPLLGLAQSGTLTGGWAAQVVGPGPGSPTAEAMVSKAIQCGFESHPGHKKAHQNVSGS